MALDLKNLAQALGGDFNRDQVLAPGPGHSRQDRSLSITLSTSASDGFIVHSFAGDDPIECKDYVRQKIGLTPFQPNGRGSRASDASVDAALRAAVAGQQQRTNGRIVATYDYRDADGTLLYQSSASIPKASATASPTAKAAGHGREANGVCCIAGRLYSSIPTER